VKACIVFAWACWLCFAGQQSDVRQTNSVDINGNVVKEGPTISQAVSPNGSQTVATTQSINGRTVPLEEVETHVLRNDASGKVTERIVRRYDPQGNALPPTRQVIEEQARPDGGSTVQSTTYSADINGNTQVTEKSITDTKKSDSGQMSETVVQRPTLNGLETVQKESTVVSKQPNGYQSESTTYRRNGNGEFYPAVRQTTAHSAQGPDATDNTAEYERDAYGELALHGQTVTHTITRPDGLKDAVVDIFSLDVPGTVAGSGSGLKLQERQIIDSAPGPGGQVVQTFSVQRPTVSDPNALGPPRQLSQTVCKGNCKPPQDSGK
jgi:hypothetical protein